MNDRNQSTHVLCDSADDVSPLLRGEIVQEARQTRARWLRVVQAQAQPERAPAAQDVATACIFLANKVEEYPKKVFVIVRAVRECLRLVPLKEKTKVGALAGPRRAPGARYGGSCAYAPLQEYVELRERIFQTERLVLHTLRFEFDFPNPYNTMVEFVQHRLKGAWEVGAGASGQRRCAPEQGTRTPRPAAASDQAVRAARVDLSERQARQCAPPLCRTPVLDPPRPPHPHPAPSRAAT